MLDKNNEVFFGEYCKTCKYKNYSETDCPCSECIAEPVNLYSHKPIRWDGADGVFSGPPPRPDHAYQRAVKYVPERRKDKEKAIARQNIDAEYAGNKVQSISDSVTDDQYPSATAVKKALENKIDAPQTAQVGEVLTVEEVDADGKPTKWKTQTVDIDGVLKYTEQELTSEEQAQTRENIGAESVANKITIISGESTDEQYPSAKAVNYTMLWHKKGDIVAKTFTNDSHRAVFKDVLLTVNCSYKITGSETYFSVFLSKNGKLYINKSTSYYSVSITKTSKQIDDIRYIVDMVFDAPSVGIFSLGDITITYYEDVPIDPYYLPKAKGANAGIISASSGEYDGDTCLDLQVDRESNRGFVKKEMPTLQDLESLESSLYKGFAELSVINFDFDKISSVMVNGEILSSPYTVIKLLGYVDTTGLYNNYHWVYSFLIIDCYGRMAYATVNKSVIYKDTHSSWTVTQYNPAPIFYVTITSTTTDGVTTYTADKTFEEIKAAYENGANVYAEWDSFILLLRTVNTNSGMAYFDTYYRNAENLYHVVTCSVGGLGVRVVDEPIQDSRFPTTAQVGQIVKVKAVDADGKVTEAEAVDMSTIVSVTYDEETGNLQIGG